MRVLRLAIVFLSMFLFVSHDWIMAAEPPKPEEKPKMESKPMEFKPKVSGYIETWYRLDDSDLSNQTTASKKVDNEFRVRRARIDVKGSVDEEIGYRVNGAFDGPSPASGSHTGRYPRLYRRGS